MKLTFNNFLIAINKKVNNRLHCSIDDLADFNYFDYWDDDWNGSRDGNDNHTQKEIEFNYAVDSCVDDLIQECETDSCLWGIQGVDY